MKKNSVYIFENRGLLYLNGEGTTINGEKVLNPNSFKLCKILGWPNTINGWKQIIGLNIFSLKNTYGNSLFSSTSKIEQVTIWK